MCIFALQVFPILRMCFYHWSFNLLFNSSLLRCRERLKVLSSGGVCYKENMRDDGE